MLIEHWMKTGAREVPAVIAEKIDDLNQLILSSNPNAATTVSGRMEL